MLILFGFWLEKLNGSAANRHLVAGPVGWEVDKWFRQLLHDGFPVVLLVLVSNSTNLWSTTPSRRTAQVQVAVRVVAPVLEWWGRWLQAICVVVSESACLPPLHCRLQPAALQSMAQWQRLPTPTRWARLTPTSITLDKLRSTPMVLLAVGKPKTPLLTRTLLARCGNDHRWAAGEQSYPTAKRNEMLSSSSRPAPKPPPFRTATAVNLPPASTRSRYPLASPPTHAKSAATACTPPSAHSPCLPICTSLLPPPVLLPPHLASSPNRDCTSPPLRSTDRDSVRPHRPPDRTNRRPDLRRNASVRSSHCDQPPPPRRR
jgi:hypothetical protein